MDSGFRIEPVFAVCDRLFEQVLPQLDNNVRRDPKSRLVMLAQKDLYYSWKIVYVWTVPAQMTAYRSCTFYSRDDELGSGQATFVVTHDDVEIARCSHKSALAAEQLTAKAALEVYDKFPERFKPPETSAWNAGTLLADIKAFKQEQTNKYRAELDPWAESSPNSGEEDTEMADLMDSKLIITTVA